MHADVTFRFTQSEGVSAFSKSFGSHSSFSLYSVPFMVPDYFVSNVIFYNSFSYSTLYYHKGKCGAFTEITTYIVHI